MITCQDYRTFHRAVIDDDMIIGGKPKNSERNLLSRRFVHHEVIRDEVRSVILSHGTGSHAQTGSVNNACSLVVLQKCPGVSEIPPTSTIREIALKRRSVCTRLHLHNIPEDGHCDFKI